MILSAPFVSADVCSIVLPTASYSAVAPRGPCFFNSSRATFSIGTATHGVSTNVSNVVNENKYSTPSLAPFSCKSLTNAVNPFKVSSQTVAILPLRSWTKLTNTFVTSLPPAIHRFANYFCFLRDAQRLQQ